MGRTKTFWLFLSLSFLAAGFLLYALLRPLPWMPWPAVFRQVPLFLHQHLPDAFWTASFSSFLLFFQKANSSSVWTLLWPLFSCGILEVLQALMFWPGTGDVMDVIFAAGGTGLVFLILKSKKNEREYAA